MATVGVFVLRYTGQSLRPDDSHHLIRCPGWSWPLPLSLHPYQDHSKCAHQAVKWKSLMGPLSASKNSLPFPLCAPFIGILKAIKYDNSAISSRLNFSIIALNQSYFFFTWTVLFPPWCTYGQWCISSYHGGNERTLVSTEVTQWPKLTDMLVE